MTARTFLSGDSIDFSGTESKFGIDRVVHSTPEICLAKSAPHAHPFPKATG
jgi:hypothetical protein